MLPTAAIATVIGCPSRVRASAASSRSVFAGTAGFTTTASVVSAIIVTGARPRSGSYPRLG